MDPLTGAFLPSPPGWSLDWQGISDAIAEVEALKNCPQNPVHHGEGDVWAHTQLVCEALASDPEWRVLPADGRRQVFWAAVLHDIGKPATTRNEDGTITARGHSRRGAIMARERLWRLGADVTEREGIASLVTHHLVPFFLLEREDPMHLTTGISLTARCDWLALLARADANGRNSPDRQRLLDNVDLFAEFARDASCLDRPFPFATDHSRFEYFRRPGRDPHYEAYDDTRLTVTLLAGLPASGKDTWIDAHMPGVPGVSLDAIRAELGIGPDENQGRVVQEARERARMHLRNGEAFVWNATNLSRQVRGNCIDLCADYNARVRIVHLEAPPEALAKRNAERAAPVPEKVVARMLKRWEAPDLTEAHEVDLLTQTGGTG